MSIQNEVVQLFKKIYKVREGNPYNTRSDAMIKTALRWVKDCPSFDNAELKSLTLEEKLDQFLDSHMYMLPIPRYLQDSPDMTSNDFDLFISFLETVSLTGSLHETVFQMYEVWSSEPDIIDEVPSTYVTTLYECYLQCVPWIPIFRSSKLDHERLALIVCLWSLDPIQSQSIHGHVIEHTPIEELYRALREDSIDAKSPLEALDKTHSILRRRHYTMYVEEKLPPKEESWLQFTSPEVSHFLNDDHKEHIKRLMETYKEDTQCSLELLQSVAYIKNLIDEEIQIGFDLDSLKQHLKIE